ncbi:helix-turn-helix transcriptional regulator [Sphingobacterium spiritivorum]|uniref:DNA-binding helix-turn-helix protein n=3 Tax=Sphingobacterium spiritivorum TaxID=258 RepID=D7VQX5_SPHSI|nr:helix-turn-helix transcriptional regulator [Sphingobacterium spiritivorum]EEI93186.1 DNA-binding helix-turn-helix protein [Sphingobacterium spiritivorum ATCC 33300]EFK56176.1 DNA-binding helix-turn-helix protein [Sphingobacterium spiritivorum ATCC 33861]QQS96097.1 helix-turn-helix transcriptional regulator [Sphingobacterium spiritivorum]QQT35716.1 helix-turn-helix transcriptional regulator [Sphingobacterium spiritivorum]WQD32430.1 helix-turn-helix transcriptional regulator [Sphingobacterium
MTNTLKVERARRNMTQAELATLVEVSRQTINSIEIGKYVPSTLLALKIAAVFEISIESLFNLEESDWNR